MVSPSVKAQLKREIEVLEKAMNEPVPASKMSTATLSSMNYYSNLESQIKDKKKQMYGGAMMKVKVVIKKVKSKTSSKKTVKKPKAKKPVKKA